MSSEIDPDVSYMLRAIDLAQRGLGAVEPNPAVGAVVVDRDGRVVGEGWHERFGGPHAEVNALRVAGEAARGATLYVTLEPCCHFGKTPPCSRTVIAAGIQRVVIGATDPARHSPSSGIDELRSAGIQVEVGLLDDQAQRLIAPFQKLTVQGMPWFHAKWAMTLDGRTASRTGSSQWISNEQSRAVVHQLRGRMDAILVGIGTVLADDPLLTARPAGPRVACRIVLDSEGRTPLDSLLLRTISQSPVLIVTASTAMDERCNLLRSAGAEVLKLSGDDHGKPGLVELAKELGRRRMTNVLVEGGATVLGSFFDQGFVDEVHAFIAPKIIGGSEAIPAIGGLGLGEMNQALRLEGVATGVLDGDVYIHGHVSRQ